MPSLSVARDCAGAAYVGSSVYLIGGVTQDGQNISTIERLNLAAQADNLVWQLIQLDADAPSYRRDSAIVAYSDSEIAIFGG